MLFPNMFSAAMANNPLMKPIKALDHFAHSGLVFAGTSEKPPHFFPVTDNESLSSYPRCLFQELPGGSW